MCATREVLVMPSHIRGTAWASPGESRALSASEFKTDPKPPKFGAARLSMTTAVSNWGRSLLAVFPDVSEYACRLHVDGGFTVTSFNEVPDYWDD